MFKPIELPYALNALEPVISAKTLEFHYGKHLQGYVDNLNKLVAGLPYEDMPIESVFRHSEGAIYNNAGQIINHNLYFQQFVPLAHLADIQRENGLTASEEELARYLAPSLFRQIDVQWESFQAFKDEFTGKGVSLFGSGWVWLSGQADGTLVITQEKGADNPLLNNMMPILTFDVWEHAYYLDYQNRRPSHLQSLWSILNWKVMEDRYVNRASTYPFRIR